MKNASLYEPPGIRGDGPTAAARYWGLSQQDYYKKADVWPLNPEGEIFCVQKSKTPAASRTSTTC